MKPIARWTIGNIFGKTGYEILDLSIKNFTKLYLNDFDYYVCYNDVDLSEIKNLEKRHKKVSFIKQDWKDCPLEIEEPNFVLGSKQKANGSFWKICPPRLKIDVHEIVLDNDIVFLKRSKLIENFLSRTDKNLIVKDSNIYLGKFKQFFPNEKQGYNSGLMGLMPNYDFYNDLKKNYEIIKTIKNKDNLHYGQEQGLLMYTLFKTNPLIGCSEEFVGIHPNEIYLNCLSNKIASKFKLFVEKSSDLNKNKTKELSVELLKEVFKYASAVHFLQANRFEHFAWNYFSSLNSKVL